MAKSQNLYLKIPQTMIVKERKVTLGDIAKMECTDTVALCKIKQIRVHTFQEQKNKKKHQKQVMSVLKVIELIHGQFPDMQVDNLGEIDFVIVYEKEKEKKAFSWIKTAVLCVVIFFGGAFTIMAFNNDVGVNNIFAKLSYQVTGELEKGTLVLQVTYSIGLSIGILVFYNHLGRKKIGSDPTPVQVEMCKYEADSDSAYIEDQTREGNCEEIK